MPPAGVPQSPKLNTAKCDPLTFTQGPSSSSVSFQSPGTGSNSTRASLWSSPPCSNPINHGGSSEHHGRRSPLQPGPLALHTPPGLSASPGSSCVQWDTELQGRGQEQGQATPHSPSRWEPRVPAERTGAVYLRGPLAVQQTPESSHTSHDGRDPGRPVPTSGESTVNTTKTPNCDRREC